MKALLLRLLRVVGQWLYNINNDQFHKILDFVNEANIMGASGPEKYAWVKAKISEYLSSYQGKQFFSGLTNSAFNWLIESAVGYLKR